MSNLFVLLISVAQVSTLAGAGSWTPPIGIPTPPFGITETYRMYDVESARNPALAGIYKPSNEGGYYTHFIDSNNPASTDSGNACGTYATPRKTVPVNLTAGSVVEINNKVDKNGGSPNYCFITGEGSVAYPIFVRGVNNTFLTDFTLRIGNRGDSVADKTAYLIVENIGAKMGNLWAAGAGVVYNNHHIAVRNCNFTGGGVDAITGGFNFNSYSDNFLEYCVLYNSEIHDTGHWDVDDPWFDDPENQDNDIGSLSIGSGIRYVWVLENVIYHIESDGFIICPHPQGIINTDDHVPHHIYVGRNVSHHNKQHGFFTKTARDVIFSQNTAYGHRISTSGVGAGLGTLYVPQRIWSLFNYFYDNDNGISSGSKNFTNAGNVEDIYHIGNQIVNTYVSAFNMNGTGLTDTNMYILFNIVHNAVNGIRNSYGNLKLNIFNNILGDVEHNTNTTSSTTISNALFDHNLVDGSGNFIWGSTYANLAAFIAGTIQGDNCVEADPLFVNPENGDFNLQEASPINNMATSEQVEEVFDRFYELYGIDIGQAIIGQTSSSVPNSVPSTGSSGQSSDTSGSSGTPPPTGTGESGTSSDTGGSSGTTETGSGTTSGSTIAGTSTDSGSSTTGTTQTSPRNPVRDRFRHSTRVQAKTVLQQSAQTTLSGLSRRRERQLQQELAE